MTSPQYKEVLKELKEVKTMLSTQGSDIDALKQWKVAEDAYKAALVQVRKDERDEKSQKLKDREAKAWLDIIKQVGPIVTILGAVIYAWAASRGLH